MDRVSYHMMKPTAMITPRILIADDEKHLREGVKLNLELEGYEVEEARDGREALDLHGSQRFNLLILDVMMPEIDGFEVCERVRLTDQETPILFLTAKDTGGDRVSGLKRGADDYLAKPFNLEELLLRAKVLVKHSLKGTEAASDLRTYSFGDNTVDFANYEAHGIHGPVSLTKKEGMLLKLLVDRRGEVVSRQQILQSVWGYDVFPSTRTIDNFILSFRKYFEPDPKEPRYFLSVRGIGYKFMGDEE